MMSGIRMRSILLTLALCLFAFIAWKGGIALRDTARNAMAHLEGPAAELLSEAMGREVVLERLDASKRGRIELKGLRIASEDLLKNGAVIEAPRAEAVYDPDRLLSSLSSPLDALTSIDLYSPYLLIERDRENKFNLQRLLKRKRPPAKPVTFRGVARVHSARVEYRDFNVRALPSPQSNLATISATIDGSSSSALRIAARGIGDGYRVGPAECEGSFVAETGALRLRIGVDSQDGPYWLRFFSNLADPRIERGTAHATIDVWKAKKNDFLTASVNVAVKDATVRTAMSREPIKRVRGNVVLRTGYPMPFLMDLSGDLAGVDTRLFGSLFVHPETGLRGALTASTSKLTPAGLRRIVPEKSIPSFLIPDAAIALKVWASVSDGHWSTSLKVATNSMKVMSLPMKTVRAEARYQDGILTVPRVEALLAGSKLHAGGIMNTRADTLRWIVDVPPTSARALTQSKVPVDAKVSGRILVQGRTSRPVTEAIVMTAGGRYEGISFRDVVAELGLQNGRVQIKRAQGTVAGGDAFIAGAVGLDGSSDLMGFVRGVDLKQVGKAVAAGGLEGSGFADVRVTGPILDPKVRAEFQILGGAFKPWTSDMISGKALWNNNILALSDVLVARYPAQVALGGFAARGKDGVFDLNFEAEMQTGRLERLLADGGAENVPLTGLVAGRIQVTGNTKSPTVVGDALVTDAMASGFPVDRASGTFSYENGVLRVPYADAEGENIFVRGSDFMLTEGKLNGRFEADSIAFTRSWQPLAPYASLEGWLAVSEGEVSGTTKAPVLAAKVSGDALRVNGLEMDTTRASVAWDGETLRVENAEFKRHGEAVISAPMVAWRTGSESLDADIRTDGLQIADVLGALSRSPWIQTDPKAQAVRQALLQLPENLGGAITIRTKTTGDLKDVSLDADLSIADVRFGDQKLDRVALSGHVKNALFDKGQVRDALVEVPPDGLVVESGDMYVSGEFRGRWSGNIEAASLNAVNVPMAIASAFLPERFRGVDGMTTAFISAEGPMRAPVIRASLESDHITYNGAELIDRLATQAITVAEHKIDVNGIQMNAHGQTVEAEGEIPFRWSPIGIPQDEPIRVSASMEPQSLAVLQAIARAAGKGTPGEATGKVEGSLTAGGTLLDPKLNGYVELKDAGIGVKGLQNRFEGIHARVDFSGAGATISDLQILTPPGTGSLKAVPDSRISVRTGPDGKMQVNANVGLVLDNFLLDEQRNALDMGERFKGLVSGKVTMRGDVRAPLISGDIEINEVDFAPPSMVNAAMVAERKLSTDPRFDLSLTAGRNVLVRSSLYRVRVDDRAPVADRRIRLSGTLSDPVIQGAMTSREGVVYYPTARFRLKEARLDLRYPPLSTGTDQTASAFRITAKAETRVTAQVNGRNRPVNVELSVDGPNDGFGQMPGIEAEVPFRMVLRSLPSLPERQLLALFTREESLTQLASGGTTAEQVLWKETVNVLRSSVLPQALSGVESVFGRLLALEDLTLDYAEQERALSVSASKRLTKNLVVTYSQPLNAVGESASYDLTLSYELTGNLRLSLSHQQGPYLISKVGMAGPTRSVSSAQSTLRDTSLLLEGSLNF